MYVEKEMLPPKANESPDKITSKGLPKEFSDFANDQLSRINYLRVYQKLLSKSRIRLYNQFTVLQ